MHEGREEREKDNSKNVQELSFKHLNYTELQNCSKLLTVEVKTRAAVCRLIKAAKH